MIMLRNVFKLLSVHHPLPHTVADAAPYGPQGRERNNVKSGLLVAT
jgi:hypothetical protein